MTNNSFVIRPENIAINPNQPIHPEEEIDSSYFEILKEPDEELDDDWGDIDDYKRFKDICYDYCIMNNTLITHDNIQSIYGKSFEELNDAEKAAYECVSFCLEEFFEVHPDNI